MNKIYSAVLIMAFVIVAILQLQVLDEISQLGHSLPQVPGQLAGPDDSATVTENTKPVRLYSLSEEDRVFITESIRSSIKTELEGLSLKSVAASARTEENPVDHARAQQSFEISRTILDDALARGNWTQQDFNQIIPHLQDLTPQQRDQLSLKFVESINSGQIDIKHMNKGIIPF